MAEYDGSITLSTNIDTSGIKRGINSIEGAVGKLGRVLGTVLAVRQFAGFIKSSTELASNVQEVQNVVDVAFGSMKDKMEAFADTAIETYGISKLTAKKTGSTYMAMAKGLGINEEAAADMALRLTGLTADLASFYNVSQEMADTALKSVFTGETESLKQYGIVMTEINLQEYAYTQGIKKKISKMTQQEKVMLRYRYILEQTALAQGDFARTANSWANQTRMLTERWKEAKTVWGDAFITLGTLGLPVLNKAIDLITDLGYAMKEAANYIAYVVDIFGLLKSPTNDVADNIENTGEGIQSSTDGLKEMNKEIKEAEKEAKKLLAPFDEISILASEAAEETAISDIVSAPALGGTVETTPTADTGSQSGVGSGIEIDPEFAKLGGAALVALGAMFFCIGLWGLGVGFIIAGVLAGAYGIAMEQEKDGDVRSAVASLAEFGEMIAGYLVLIGLLFLIGGIWGWGFGFIIVGATLFGVSEEAVEKNGTQTAISSWLEENEALIVGVAMAMLLLGIVLLFVPGAWGWALALIAAGAVALVAEVAIEKGAVMQEIQSFLQENQAIINQLGVKMFILGMLLLAMGLIGLGVAMIVMGSVGVIAEVVANWDAIDQEISNFIDAHRDMIGAAGALSFLLGIVLIACGMLPLGLGLIAAGAVGMGLALKPDGSTLLNWLKDIWSDICAWFNEKVKPIFTGNIWANLGKAVVNGINGALELGLNGLIDMINVLISGLDGLVNMAGDIIGLDLHIPEIPHIKIPRLAKGEVLPANKPFLAMVGDQKHGTNVETPLATMIEAFNIALDSRGGDFGGTVEVPLVIGGREFGRASIKWSDIERQRTSGNRATTRTKVVFGK